MRQHTAGRSQYYAAILKAEKRFENGWVGRVNYTCSGLMDNQFGETNFQQPNTPEALNAYDLDGEYALGVIDVPHKLVVAPTVELPFGEGKRWATSGLGAALLGRWTITSILSFESGFLIPVASGTNNANLFTRMQRANPTRVSPGTEGDFTSRIDEWLNPAAYEVPPAFTLGTGRRTDGRVRGPHRSNWDLAVAKDVPMGRNLRGQFRLEVINLTNTVKVIGPIHTVGSSGFGQIRSQSGFMRMVQFIYRMTF